MTTGSAQRILALAASLALLAWGCGEKKEAPEAGEPVREAASAGTSPATEVESAGPSRPASAAAETDTMGDQRKLKELRDLWEAKQFAYIIPMAEGLAGRPNLDPLTRLEVCWLLAQAYAGAGEAQKAAEASKRYDKLKEEFLKSDTGKSEAGTRGAVQRLVGDVRKKRQENLAPEDRHRQNEQLREKLDGAPAGTVVEVEAETGGKIYCSRDADALVQRLSGTKLRGQDPVISHDTEFDYYFAIEEDQAAPSPEPPAGGGGR
ncbi:MAG: hypothetical protein HY303_16795 [Candidatus Wallbacteria bacterium]|nr:hypothetical protein [Candidatus Wallbacteria bacterium]